MVKASQAAHKMAINMVYRDGKKQEEYDSETSSEEEEEEEVEFEINDDFVEFYKESLKYKLEKSMCR
jgi:hypothetical protein